MKHKTPFIIVKKVLRATVCRVQFITLIKIGVEKVTTLEPYDKRILANLAKNCNIYCKLVLLIKLDTQTYYNMRLILGLETL